MASWKRKECSLESLTTVIMSKQFTEREMEDLQDSFSLYDKVGDGKIDIADLGDALRGLGENPTENEIKKVVSELSPNGNARISFSEFLPVLQAMHQKSRKIGHDDFIDSLKVFDNDGSGAINSGELRHVLTSLGERLRDEEVDMLIQGLEDNSGQIYYEDFVKSVLNG